MSDTIASARPVGIGEAPRVDAALSVAPASPSRTAAVLAVREGRLKTDRGPSSTRTARRERMASDVVTDPDDGPPVVIRADGLECYSPSEWRRRFGTPGICYWVRAAAEQINAAAAKRRRRVRVAVALVVVFAAGLLAGRAAAATPKPDPAPPLRYSRAVMARAVYSWSEWVLSTPDADGVAWQPWRASCSSKRRCRVDGAWLVDDATIVATYRLRRCIASRRVWESDLARTRRGWVARVLIDRRGGLICRVIDPPYVPAEAQS